MLPSASVSLNYWGGTNSSAQIFLPSTQAYSRFEAFFLSTEGGDRGQEGETSSSEKTDRGLGEIHSTLVD